jgi:hypothetical protein
MVRGKKFICHSRCSSCHRKFNFGRHCFRTWYLLGGAFDEEEIRKILKLKRDFRPLAIIPVGYEK